MADVQLRLVVDGVEQVLSNLNLTQAELGRIKENLSEIKNSKIKTELETQIKGMPIEQVRQLHSQLKQEFKEKIAANVDLSSLDETRSKINAVENALFDLTDEGEGLTNGLADGFARFGLAINGVQQAVNIVMGMISKPLEVAGQFEKYTATLKVMLGGMEQAQERMAEYVRIGATTPFELSDVVELGNGLQALGKYSEDNVRMLGDLAAASGKPIQQVANAFSKLATGDLGMAKNMFKDMLVTADDWKKHLDGLPETAENMMAALPRIMGEKGFAGMMDEQAKTLGGIESNFQDTITGLMNDIGQDLLPLAKDVFKVLIDGIGLIRGNLDILKPVLAVVSVATASWMVSTYGAAAALHVKSTAVKVATTITQIWNKTLMANPIGLVIGAVAGLVVALGQLNKYMSESNLRALENAEASKEMTQNQIKDTETKIKASESVEKLAERYKELSEKANRTSAEQKELEAITKKLNEKYPAIIQSGDSYANNLERIRKQTEKNRGETAQYRKELEELNKQLNQNNRDVASSKMNVAKDEFVNAMVDANLTGFGSLGDQLAELVVGTSGTRGNIEKAYSDVVKQMYSAKNIDEINKARSEFHNRLKQANYADKDILELTGKFDSFAKERENYLRVTNAIKDVEYETSSDAIEKWTLAGKTITQVEDQLTKLRTEQKNTIKGSKEELELRKEIKSLENYLKGDDKKETDKDKAFKEHESKLAEEQRHKEAVLKLEKASNKELLQTKIDYLGKQIDLYNRFGKDKTKLLNQLKETEKELYLAEDKDTAIDWDYEDKEAGKYDDQFNKEFVDSLNEKQSASEEYRQRKATLDINSIDNEFERKRKLLDWEKQQEYEKYALYSNFTQMKQIIDEEYAREKMKLDEAEQSAKLNSVKQTLNIMAGMVNEHTAVSKGIAIASATINTYEGATTALKTPGGLLGLILMGTIIASGMQQVANIIATEPPKMKGFAKGGVVVGEAGLEIISPMQDYAQGQVNLINAVVNQLGGGYDNLMMSNFINELRGWSNSFNFKIERGDLYASYNKESNTRALRRF